MEMMSEETYREYENDMREESLTQGQYMSEAVRQYASSSGADAPDVEWISTPFDTWERNPHFTGTPGRHPEDEYEYDYQDGDLYTYNDTPICWEGEGFYFWSASDPAHSRSWERVTDDRDHADLTARGYELIHVRADDIEIS